MTALFTLPGQTPVSAGSYLPGAKLAFTVTATSTPQDTYQDEALLTPHTNPVVADANGLFPAIYLDPRAPSYRVVLKTSADVVVKTWDGVPSNQNRATASRLESADPNILFYDTDGTADSRKARVRVFGNEFQVDLLNDSESVPTRIISTPGGILTFAATAGTGTYTGTLTGFATPPTGTIRYCVMGAIVALYIPSAGSGLSGTSNSTAMTITGMPAAIRPARTQIVQFPGVGDNSLLIGDGEQILAQIGTDGVITFLINGSATGFTASGTKGTGAGGTITYLTN